MLARGNGCEAEDTACAKVQMRQGRVQKCKGGGSRFGWRVAAPGGRWRGRVTGRAVIAIAAVRDRRREVIGP